MSSPPCTNVKAPIDDFLATVLVSVNVATGVSLVNITLWPSTSDNIKYFRYSFV